MHENTQDIITTMQSVMDRLDIASTATSQCCPHCNVRLKKSISIHEFYLCPICDVMSTGYHLRHQALPEFSPMEDEAVARSLTYYHWSTKKNWIEDLPEDVMAHMGSKQAAWKRMRDEWRKMPIPGDKPEGVVYFLTINAGACFQERMTRDEEDPASKVEGCYSAVSKGYVERYVNVVEAPGSISLCAAKHDISVVGKMNASEFFGETTMEIPQKNARRILEKQPKVSRRVYSTSSDSKIVMNRRFFFSAMRSSLTM